MSNHVDTHEPFMTTGPRMRSRTRSLISVSSIFEIRKEPLRSVVSTHSEKEEVYGYFIPARSATSSLKVFVAFPSLTTRPKPKKVTFVDTHPPSHWRDTEPSPEKVSYPTHRFALSSSRGPPSPTSSSSSILDTPYSSDLHPILAKLEKNSKFCSQITQCSTCQKPGSDFPRCAKCGDMWCSRACRLVGGKRHTCKVQHVITARCTMRTSRNTEGF